MPRFDMDDKICISIGEISFTSCMQLAVTSPLFEIRLDLMHMDVSQIELLAMQSRQWVATCRAGRFSEDERTVQLSAAIRSGATYVDLEYESEENYRRVLTDLARQLRCKVIISYHNFEKTPDTGTLNRIIADSKDMGADVVKLAVTANTAADCARIMSLYEKHDHIIAFAMGEQGKITRIAAPLLGAPFTFASIDETHLTAPGQMTVSQMKVIYRSLGNE